MFLRNLFYVVLLLSLYSCQTSDEIIVDNYPYPAPEASDAKNLAGTDIHKLRLVLESIESPKDVFVMGNTEISDEQYNEIKEYTENYILQPSSTNTTSAFNNKISKESCTKSSSTSNTRQLNRDDIKTIISWVNKNISYGNTDNKAYTVFKERRGVCQGFANLLKVILLSQGIPTLIVNGETTFGAHAWNYVYFDGKWYVCDPTNGESFTEIEQEDRYASLNQPLMIPGIIIGEDSQYKYSYNRGIAIADVKDVHFKQTFTGSLFGYRATSIDLITPLPSRTHTLCIGKYISFIGEDYKNIPLSEDSDLAWIDVAEGNKTFLAGEDTDGLLYLKSLCDEIEKNTDSQSNASFQSKISVPKPLIVPPAKKSIELMNLGNTVEKELILNHKHLERITFGLSVKEISSDAIMNCPKLETIFIPIGCAISETAFNNVGNYRIVTYDGLSLH